MAELVHGYFAEEILIKLDVKDLIRYKTVCKSWHSLITSRGFITRHLNHSYNKDRNNNELAHRRFRLTSTFSTGSYCHPRLVGSSDGLVCISSDTASKLLVANPLTREIRHLNLASPASIECFGFGYDFSNNDYKVIMGQRNLKNQTSTTVQVLSLKSNVWRVIGEVNFCFETEVGILYNGALHWIVTDDDEHDEKKWIISYDLSKDEFNEIPQPARCKLNFSSRLGIMKNCLCIFEYGPFTDNVVSVWLMKNYNVKQSWEPLLRPLHQKGNHDIVHFLISPKNESLFHDDHASLFSRTLEHQEHVWDYIDSPVFVQSLISPVNQGWPEFKAFEAVKMTEQCVNRGRRRSKKGKRRSRKTKSDIWELLFLLFITLLILFTLTFFL